mgnify:CR=1 FL=1
MQEPPGGRFVYLSWGTDDGPGTFMMFRRAKIRLDQIPPVILVEAVENGSLTAGVGLTDANGNATARPSSSRGRRLRRRSAMGPRKPRTLLPPVTPSSGLFSTSPRTPSSGSQTPRRP